MDSTRISKRRLLKAFVTIVLSLLMGNALSAQTQVGIVKTRGRMVNGELVRGKGIPDATVQLKDRSVLSQKTNGTFSFPVTGQKYAVKSVQKAGYQLLDPQVCREYDLSRDTLYLVMETPEQIRFDEMEKERSLRKKLETKLQEKEDEILAMNVTLEEKNRLLSTINWQRQEVEKSISTLAKQHASIDYDVLDDFQRQVNINLELGEIDKAFSLLNSRGSMESRIREIHWEQVMEKEEEDELARREEKLFQSKQGTQKKLEDAAADCYSYYRGFFQNFQLDSAFYYLGLRASLDTLNVDWQMDAGSSATLLDQELAMMYFRRVVRHASPTDRVLMECYEGMARIYEIERKYSKALECYTEALRIADAIGDDHERLILNSLIAKQYSKDGDYSKELEHIKNTLPILNKIYGANDKMMADYYDRLGAAYKHLGDYSKAIDSFRKSLAIRKDAIAYEKAETYMNICLLYYNQGDYKKAVDNGLKAISLMKDFLNLDESMTYHGGVANAYRKMGNLPKALEYYQKALTLYETYSYSNEYEAMLTYEVAGDCCKEMKDYSKSVEYYKKASEICVKMYGLEHQDVALIYNRIGVNYLNLKDLSMAREYFLAAYAIMKKLHEGAYPDLITVIDNIGWTYYLSGNYTVALVYFRNALENRIALYGPDDPRLATSYENLAEAYYLADEKSLAEEYSQKAKALSK